MTDDVGSAGAADTSKGARRRLGALAGLGAAIALLAVNGLLWSQNRTLKAELAMLRSRSRVAFDIGARVPDITLVDDTGARIELRELDGTSAILAFLTTECPFCLESVPVWKDLASAAKPMGKRLIGISFDSEELTRAWAERWEVDFEVWRPASADDVAALGLSSVPVTVAIAGGRVHLSVSGSLRGRTVRPSILRVLRD